MSAQTGQLIPKATHSWRDFLQIMLNVRLIICLLPRDTFRRFSAHVVLSRNQVSSRERTTVLLADAIRFSRIRTLYSTFGASRTRQLTATFHLPRSAPIAGALASMTALGLSSRRIVRFVKLAM